MRVVTYNIRALRDDAKAVARVLRALAPDVVCIQEAPRFLRWRTKVAGLARESGLVYVTGGRSSGAQVLFADVGVDVLAVREIKLSKHPRLHQRGLAVAECRKAGRAFSAASIHLGLAGDERRTHIEEVLHHLRNDSSGARVLAGDFNEVPGGPVVSALQPAGWRDCWEIAPSGGEFTAPEPRGPLTFGPRNFARRIDYVFVGSGIEVRACGVPVELADLSIASDHLPVLAVLALPDS